jgi:hypothetical protein
MGMVKEVIAGRGAALDLFPRSVELIFSLSFQTVREIRRKEF